jgi:hypothetical protein
LASIFCSSASTLTLPKWYFLAFVDRVGDHEAVLVGRQLGDRRDHAEVVVAAVAVELAQLLAVVLDPVGVVIVVVGQELVPTALLGDDHVAQVVVRELDVAEDVDRQHAALGAFGDLEHQVDALLRQLDHLRGHRGADPARAAVELDDPLDVGLHLGLGEDAARANGHLVAQLVFLHRGIPLEDDLVDDRVLDHLHHQFRALQLDLHVGEQLGAGQGLQRQVEARGVDRVADLDRQVAEHGALLDPLVALHGDRADHAALLRLRIDLRGRHEGRCAEHQREAGSERSATGAEDFHRFCHWVGARLRKTDRRGN